MRSSISLKMMKKLMKEFDTLSERLSEVYGIDPEEMQKAMKRKGEQRPAKEIFEEGIARERKKLRKKAKKREAEKAAKEQAKKEKAARRAAEQAEYDAEQQRRIQEARFREKTRRREKLAKLKAATEQRVSLETKRIASQDEMKRAKKAKKSSAEAQSRYHPRNPAYLPHEGMITAPAIILKPKMDRIATGEEPIRLGGCPQLPADVTWPGEDGYRAHHFFAQIDLAALPRRLSGPGYDFDLPAFPQQGTLFVFKWLERHGIYDIAPEVVFVPGSVAHLPERDPPDNIPLLTPEAASELNPAGISSCQRMLRRQYAEPIAYMSTRRPNGSDAERPVKEGKVPLSDAERAALLNAGLELTVNEDTTNPEPTSDDSDWDRYVAQSTRIPASEHGIDSPHRFRWEYRQPQMFGHGDDIQNASAQHMDKVMLIQLGNAFGTPLQMMDVSLQLWITPQDLAEGRFDRVVGSMDAS